MEQIPTPVLRLRPIGWATVEPCADRLIDEFYKRHPDLTRRRKQTVIDVSAMIGAAPVRLVSW